MSGHHERDGAGSGINTRVDVGSGHLRDIPLHNGMCNKKDLYFEKIFVIG